MWADDSGDEGPSQRSGFGSNKVRKPKNYSAPVSFVAGGVQQAGKKKDKDSAMEKKDEGDEEDDHNSRELADTSESR